MQQGQQCAVCHHIKNQVLMLTCLHDPCLSCASTNFFCVKTNKNPNEYICSLCQEVTQLDPSSVVQLERIMINQKKVSRNENKKNTYRKKNIENNDYENYSIPQKKYQNERTNRQLKYDDDQYQTFQEPHKVTKLCRTHHDQEISYYCFKCFQNICPECVIHGSHKGHDVKLVKKAINEIKKQYLSFIQKMNVTQQIYRNNKEQTNKKMKNLVQIFSSQKSDISKQFEQIRTIINSRQKYIIKQLQELHKKNIGLLQSEMKMIQKQNEQAIEFKKSVEAVLKKQQLLILQQFSEKSELLKSKIQKYTQMNKFETVPGIKYVNLIEIKKTTNQIKQNFNTIKFITINNEFIEQDKQQLELYNT